MSQEIEHNGIIDRIDGNKITVHLIQLSACSGCHAKGACSAADMDDKYIEVDSNDASLQVGDMVTLYGQSSKGLFAVLLAFVIPFSIILITLIILRYFIENDAISGLISLGVLIPYYLILSFFNDKLKSKLTFYIKKQTE